MISRKVVPFSMAFTGFPAAGIDLLQLNRLQNSREFYESHKEEIKRLAIQPFHELIAEMTPAMLEIDPLFVVTPSRMVSRVRRDTRYTKDKTLYRANMWMFFRRPRREHESVPCYYFEIHPEFWGFGCWGAWGKGEMEALREMILKEDKLFLEAYEAVRACPQVRLDGELYKRPKFPDAKPAYQTWLNRKEIGVDFRETNDFSPVLDGSFVGPMVDTMRRLAPLYRFLLAAKERAGAAPREALE
ncbi:DUF2461 domain-containing protein [Agathobaculum ammoniilyticum]|nr:DUF2461 domain-containing protein [Agathobaculum ammoniilyticum]